MNVKPIRSERDYTAALARAESLMDAEPGTAEGHELEVLSLLIETWEARRHPMEELDPVDFLVEAMALLGYEQSDLAAVLGSRPRASEILNRKRPLTLPMIRAISRQWQLPADALVAEYPLAG